MLVTKKVSKNIGVIARIKHCLPHKIVLSLYYTFHIAILYGAPTIKLAFTIYLFSKNGLLGLYVTCPRISSTKASFCKLNLLTLNNINKYQILLFMFRYHHSLLPKTINI